MTHTISPFPLATIAEKRNARFELQFDRSPGSCSVRVLDRRDQTVFMQWHGAVASAVIRYRGLDLPPGRTGRLHCSKAAIWDVALYAAAASVVVGSPQVTTPALLQRRLADRCIVLPAAHEAVAITLFRHPGAHLSHEDVLCLVCLQNPASCEETVSACLEDLTNWQLIQRIVVKGRHVFFDIDLRPHLHLFDPSTNSLQDAPLDGVVVASSGEDWRHDAVAVAG